MDTDFEKLAQTYHDRLPGIVRAALNDGGIANAVIDRHQIGWDDEEITIPVRSRSGAVAFFERWSDVGVVAEETPAVELFPWETVLLRPPMAVFCEGIQECLVVESAGLPAVCATGSGRYFKAREWREDLARIPTLLIALKNGEKRDRRMGRPSRSEVVEKIETSVPDGRVIRWPADLGDGAGAVDFLLKRGALGPWLRDRLELNA